MSRVTKAIVFSTVAAGGACLYVASQAPSGAAALTSRQWAIAAVIGILILDGWLRPFVIFRDGASSTFHLDEGFFVILALTLPPVACLSTLAVTTVLAQAIRRRPLLKSAFNVGLVLLAAGLGLGASRALSVSSTTSAITPLATALLAVAIYFVVNTGLLGSVMVTLGSSWKTATLDDLRGTIGLAGVGYLLGVTLALAIRTNVWALGLAVVAVVTLRGLVTARFKAQQDRARMKGLLDVALEATHQSLDSQEVLQSILGSARELLRCPSAQVTNEEPSDPDLAARFDIGGIPHWLVASGRRREEPFDEADRMLLEAMAAVGKGALTNAELYGQVRYEQKRLSSITLNIGEGICAVDADGRLTFVNPAAAEMIDVPSLNAPIDDGMTPEALRAPAFLLGPAREAMKATGTVRESDARFVGRDGRALPVEYSASAVLDHGKPVGAVIAFRDITEQKAMREELVRHAYQDSLTGLANRGLLMDRLGAALGRSALDRKTHALIFVDVDRFKSVNDSLGHTTGNDLLKEVAQRMKAAVGQRDLVARFGGDEFVALIEDVAGIEEAVAAARRICAAVERPVVLPGGFEHVASVSVGIALTEPGMSADDILRNADVAMFEAKTKGRGGSYKVFDLAAMGPRSRKRLELESALRKGLERGEIEVHYQPFFSVDDEKIVGAEALVRWRHPTEGLIPPDEFIPVAEESGLILPLGRIVLEHACRQVRAIRDRTGVYLPMSVNLSPRQFQHSGLLSEVAAALDAVGLPSESLTFEITEMMVMEDVSGASDVMKKLSRLGVRIAVDDFLVEHSTFSYLKQFPVDEVKIDRAFVQGVASDPVDTAIVQAIIRLADAMCIEAVAEGVETPEQLAGLKMLGCPVAQGYLLSRPLAPVDFEELVAARLTPPETVPVEAITLEPGPADHTERTLRLHKGGLVG